jgi:peptidoglycan/LPS O-acetylase OafA/YrhL
VNVRADRFPLMDSVRAIGALAVLAAHAALLAGIYTSGSFLRPYATQLDVAVTVFFEVSAFLLYRPFVAARLAGKPRPSTRAYAWRRFLRIVPGYWLALTGVTIWLGLETVTHPLWHLPIYYGFGQIYTADTDIGGLGQAWTLCVEASFYFFLPLWTIAVRRLTWRAELVALGGVALASVGWKVFALSHVHGNDFNTGAFTSGPWEHPLPNFLDQLALGMALAVISVHGLPEGAVRFFARAWPWWVLAAVVYWVLVNTVGTPTASVGTGTKIARDELHAVVATALLIPAVFAWDKGGAVRRLLAWRPLLYVGLVSYGVYLWNNAVLIKLSNATTGWMTDTLGFGPNARFLALFAGGIAGTVAIGSVSYQLVERPLLSLKRLVPAGPRQTEPSEAIAEPAPATPAAAK